MRADRNFFFIALELGDMDEEDEFLMLSDALFPPENLKYWIGVQRGHSYLMGRRCASLPLIGHPSSDGITIKMPYGVDVLHRTASHPIFSYWVG